MSNLTGVVYRSTGSWYQVRVDQTAGFVEARVRGKLRLQEQSLTNPIAVGDRVILSLSDEDTYMIDDFEERVNVLIRKSIKKTDHAQIIAANVDQAVCIQSIRKPKPKMGFIDRFLVTCEAYDIEPLIIISKIDLATKKDLLLLEDLKERYHSLGYSIIYSSTNDSKNLEVIKKRLQDKTSVITGHSGVGKSSLVNAIDANLDLKTSNISDFSNKGVHTTTFATMFDLEIGGRIIDTPGIKEFGLFNISKEELSLYFKEFETYRNQCKYDNCSHIHEPGCKIMQAFDNGEVDPDRYDSYIRIYESLEDR